MEENLLLACCQENKIRNAAVHLALVDKDELGRDDLTWEEIEPYIRVLGVRSRDLYRNEIEFAQDYHKIEGVLLEKYEKLCRVFSTKNLLGTVESLSSELKKNQEKIKNIKEKQAKCVELSVKNLEMIKKKFSELQKTHIESTPYCTLSLRLHNLSLKSEVIKETIRKELYNEQSIPALQMIKEELMCTYDEYNDIRALLRNKISAYEANPDLCKQAMEYSQLLKKIQQKKQDIASLLPNHT